jgi:hypothetical protein
MLGHSQPATTARYAHLADDPMKAARDAVGRHIAAAMDDGRSGGDVVDLPRSGRATPAPIKRLHVLDNVLRLNRGEFFVRHMTAAGQLLFQRIQRPRTGQEAEM